MKTIPLTQGLFAMVDDADYDAVMQFKWYAAKRGRKFYAARHIRKPNGEQTVQLLHRFLMPGVAQVDHIDGNSLNSQRENLRPATHRQNAQGFQRKRRGTTSKFRGVHWDKKYGKWFAGIEVNDKSIYLGRFIDETEAAHAYDSAAVFYFGEYASPNFDIGQITITGL